MADTTKRTGIQMRGYEAEIRRAVDSCQTVTYVVTPTYGGGTLPVSSVSLSAIGDQGFVLQPSPIPNVP